MAECGTIAEAASARKIASAGDTLSAGQSEASTEEIRMHIRSAVSMKETRKREEKANALKSRRRNKKSVHFREQIVIEMNKW